MPKKATRPCRTPALFSVNLLGHLYFKIDTHRAIGLGLETYLKMAFSIHKARYVPRLKTFNRSLSEVVVGCSSCHSAYGNKGFRIDRLVKGENGI